MPQAVKRGSPRTADDLFIVNVGDVANVTDDEVGDLVTQAIQDFDDTDIGDPTCITSGPEISVEEAADIIEQYCSQSQYYNTLIVPYISYGTGKDSAGRSKALGVETDYPINSSAAKLWLDVSFSEDNCEGSFLFGHGTDDQSRIKYCSDMLEQIILSCDIGGFWGGGIVDTCAVYRLQAAGPDDDSPLTLTALGDPGTFTCKDS